MVRRGVKIEVVFFLRLEGYGEWVIEVGDGGRRRRGGGRR